MTTYVETNQFEIHTDGACKGNPGPGGWGFLMHRDGQLMVEMVGGLGHTTNNIMELTAVVEAMEYVSGFALPKDCVLIATDSNYVVRGNNEWMAGWKARNFKDVKNKELWFRFLEAKDKLEANGVTLTLKWVKGHDGDPLNERADDLANIGVGYPGESKVITAPIQPDASSVTKPVSEKVNLGNIVIRLTDAITRADGDLNEVAKMVGVEADVLRHLMRPEGLPVLSIG